MVTVITDKLKKQSLEDLPNDDKIGMTVSSFAGTKENKFWEHSAIFKAQPGRQAAFGHNRTRSYPQNQPRWPVCRGSASNDSSVMQRTSMPPANKKLRRSVSVPEEQSAISMSPWAPRASSVWQPVRTLRKPRSESCPNNGYRLVAEPGVNAISTPPASPTPRPASANAALDVPKFFLKEGAMIAGAIATCRGENQRPPMELASNRSLLPFQRSHSQPCFDQARGCGLKRRRDERSSNGNLRPALDLAKMEETSYWRFRDRKKCLRIPKYMNKKTAEGLTAFFTEPEKFSIKPIKSKTNSLFAQVSSIMITPTSSPTKNLDYQEQKRTDEHHSEEKIKKGFCNISEPLKSPDEGVFHLDYDSELDLNSIEEDDFF